MIIKKLEVSLKENLTVLEKTKKSKNFFCSIEKGKIVKDGNEIITTISYKIKFINSSRFIASSLSNLVDNLSE